ncbi:alpha-amylase/alpha-mannosidase [Thermanaerovibrio velox DSM 12556]|uniref:Alpha-amylase/alpha-mannosidase n=1 Tax=Thermanaerovibrio velox DSM 12556 TaxID=926567 RepID=H0UNA1_9BACT|nr:DUF3536 domain-containing protein [Thermanaerovibrio velox]EHM10386.1 alpha-amylase/alpha-mannosidase [Thermanaerovibrio velox DSM 12556]
MRGICVHAHFYQPPREDPWLDEVLLDPSAAPSPDWNSRVTDECYRPNRAARLVDSSGRIVHIINNYLYMSFNVGPTLHRWIMRHDPILDYHIAQADRASEVNLGCGNAIAQCYNHMIMPLASRRDKRTQIIWGIEDFKARFGRPPAGMWLPETAVDMETLEELASFGIGFTILAPHQCAAVRPPKGPWIETPGGAGLDVTRPYRQHLPSGGHVDIIFYHGATSQAIAFGGLLDNGDRFAQHLMGLLPEDGEPRLLTIATDGETYGHHHRFGEMALARAFQLISQRKDLFLTNPGAFLKEHPPAWECRVAENTSWSCAHGVERWRSDCGCHTGGQVGWHQRWRAPLRAALDHIRDRIDQVYDQMVSQFTDPWELRNLFIKALLDRRDSNPSPLKKRQDFLKEHLPGIKDQEGIKILTLLEAQRMRLFMYTSCGWFFNDIGGIETRQILAYAQRALELTEEASGVDVSGNFREILKTAEGNTKDLPNGLEVLTRTVIPKRRTLEDMAASSIMLKTSGTFYSFFCSAKLKEATSAGVSLRIGTLSVTDQRTGKAWSGSGAVLSSGGLDDRCWLSNDKVDGEGLIRDFIKLDIISFGDRLRQALPIGPRGPEVLPEDERANMGMQRAQAAEDRYKDVSQSILEDNRRLISQLGDLGLNPPLLMTAAAEIVMRSKIRDLLSKLDTMEISRPGSPLEELLREARDMGIKPNMDQVAPAVTEALHNRIRSLRTGGEDEEAGIADVMEVIRRLKNLEVPLNLWRLQNEVWRKLESAGHQLGSSWLEIARELGFALPG